MIDVYVNEKTGYWALADADRSWKWMEGFGFEELPEAWRFKNPTTVKTPSGMTHALDCHGVYYFQPIFSSIMQFTVPKRAGIKTTTRI